MRKTNTLLTLAGITLFSLSLLTGCQKGSELDIPSYITIDTISVDINGDQGSASSKIVDAWVYTDDDLEGAYELPASFPVLKAGKTVLRIQPGIKLNGMAETRVPYPFYDTIARTVTLNREQKVDLGHIKAKYKSSTVFGWIEDFEDSGISIDTTARSTEKISRITDESLTNMVEGEINHYAGKVVLASDSAAFECTSHEDFVFSNTLPEEKSYVFLEMNYKTNCAFTVGLIVYGTQISMEPVLVVNPSEEWNKIYINFTPTVSFNSDATKFKVFFYATKPDDVEKGEIYLDNIKLLHF